MRGLDEGKGELLVHSFDVVVRLKGAGAREK